MMNLGTIVRPAVGRRLLSVSDQLVLTTSVTEATRFEEAVGDALGDASQLARTRAAFGAANALILSVAGRTSSRPTRGRGEPEFRRDPLFPPREVIDLATELFSTLGLGALRFDADETGGEVTGTDLFFGTGERSGNAKRRPKTLPRDAFVAGFAAATLSVAYPWSGRSFTAEETRCVARGDGVCVFSLFRTDGVPVVDGLSTRDAETFADAHELPNSEADAAHPPLGGLVAGETGVLMCGRERVAVVPAAYRCRLVEQVRAHLEGTERPDLLRSWYHLEEDATARGMTALLTELLARQGEPPSIETIMHLASSLGFGPLALHEFVPGHHLSLNATLPPQALLSSELGTSPPRDAALEGLARAIFSVASFPGGASPRPIHVARRDAQRGSFEFEVHMPSEARAPSEGP